MEPMMPGKYALVTGGGTSAPVDAVRSMTNGSKGGTAIEIAEELSREGINVVLLLGEVAFLRYLLRRRLYGEHTGPGIIIAHQFNTYADYVKLIRSIVEAHGQPAYAISAAAVSDFGFLDRPAHKISSDANGMTLSLPPLPKEIDNWRELFGDACRIVGFKLLTQADATVDQLVEAGARQNIRARLDATIGNFLEDVGEEEAPFWFVLPDGKLYQIHGTRDDLARAVAGFVLADKVKPSATVYQRCRTTRKILLVLRPNAGPHPNVWAAPGGGEEPCDAEVAARHGIDVRAATARREVFEELGIPLPFSKFVGIPHRDGFSSFTDPDTGKRRFWFNRAYLLSINVELTPPNVDAREVAEWRWFDPDDIPYDKMGRMTEQDLVAFGDLIGGDEDCDDA